MAYSRKDRKGRVLRKGETQRKCDGKYVYTYMDTLGRRRSIYSKDIKTLREREEQLMSRAKPAKFSGNGRLVE